MKYFEICQNRIRHIHQFRGCSEIDMDKLISPDSDVAGIRSKKIGNTRVIIILMAAVAITLAGVWGFYAKGISKIDSGNVPNSHNRSELQPDPQMNSSQPNNSSGIEVQSNGIPSQYQKSIVLAASSGYTQAVQQLIDQGTDPNASEYVNGLGYCTALMASAAKGYIETASLLISRGADINTFNVQGYDALAYAAENNNLEIVKLLLESGANPDRALGVATVDGSLEMVKQLLNAGANPNNVTARHQETPLQLAASLIDGSDIILTLIQSGGNVNQADMYGETPLFIAVEDSLTNNARILLEKGAYSNIKNNSGETPLNKAQTSEMKSLLQSYGAVR